MKIRKLYGFILTASLLLLISGCSTKKRFVKNIDGSFTCENEYGLYTLLVKKSSSLNYPVVYGSVFEYNSRIKIKGGDVKVDNKTLYRIENGEFIFKVNPGRHTFRGLSVTYKQLNTRKINIKMGDLVRIIFNLKNGDPFIDHNYEK